MNEASYPGSGYTLFVSARSKYVRHQHAAAAAEMVMTRARAQLATAVASYGPLLSRFTSGAHARGRWCHLLAPSDQGVRSEMLQLEELNGVAPTVKFHFPKTVRRIVHDVLHTQFFASFPLERRPKDGQTTLGRGSVEIASSSYHWMPTNQRLLARTIERREEVLALARQPLTGKEEGALHDALAARIFALYLDGTTSTAAVFEALTAYQSQPDDSQHRAHEARLFVLLFSHLTDEQWHANAPTVARHLHATFSKRKLHRQGRDELFGLEQLLASP